MVHEEVREHVESDEGKKPEAKVPDPALRDLEPHSQNAPAPKAQVREAAASKKSAPVPPTAHDDGLIEVQTQQVEQDVAHEKEQQGGETGGETTEEKPAAPAVEEEPRKKRPPLKFEDIKTAPFDMRFPSANQTKHCFTRYEEFHKCRKERGDEAPECEKYKRYYRSLCPSEWIEKWDDERERGVFPGPY